LTIGFTLTGRATRVVAKSGASLGDALIVTKPIGSGTIMAAEMAMAQVPGLILGEAVAAAIAVMLQGSAQASAILAHLAHAMTDVTGFGLAGHLTEMLSGADQDAHLNGATIPLIPGARALTMAGHGSSLLAANLAATAGRVFCADPVLAALLHDPQTSGGLLAAVDAADAPALLDRLIASGMTAAIIGHLGAGSGNIHVT
jgi:selenide,water dikinase